MEEKTKIKLTLPFSLGDFSLENATRDQYPMNVLL